MARGIYEKALNIQEVNELNPCLIIVDMINGFCKEGALADKGIMNIVPTIQRSIEGIKNVSDNWKDDLVFFADFHDKNASEFNDFPQHCIGDDESEIISELRYAITPNPTNGLANIFAKNSTNGFFSKNFKDYLDRKIKGNYDFVITGCCTDICILTFALTLKTYLNQNNIDAKVIVPIDSVDTFNIDVVHSASEFNEMALKLMQQQGIILTKELF